MITYDYTKIKNLTKYEKRSLRKLTLPLGVMHEYIDYDIHSNTTIVTATNTKIDRYIGWAIAANKYHETSIMVFVHPKYRRHGIGKKLVTQAAILSPYNSLEIFPATPLASAFYSHIGWGTNYDLKRKDLTMDFSELKFINPLSKRKIKLKTALKYGNNHPAYRKAKRMLKQYKKAEI